tara:strand:+ start:2244 stop:3173 length:930 start_codon:yes stop_codon:yes gene_type:complete
MNKILKYSTYFTVFVLLIITHISSAENKIILKVNNEIITTVDILNEIKYLSIISNDFKKIEKNKKIELARNSLIRQKIKLIEILKFRKNLNVDDSVFENIIRSYFINLNINNLKDFEIFFQSHSLNTKIVKEKIVIETLWNRLIYEKFSKNVKINKNEIEESIKKKENQNEYLLSEIIFNIDKKEDLDQKINLINKTINMKTFSEAALIHSISSSAKNGGKLGWIKENILSKIVKNEIKKIDIGEFTKPIVIPGGFLILKIENTREVKKNIDLNKEIKNIIKKKTNDQLNIFSNIYLNKLKKSIQINEI